MKQTLTLLATVLSGLSFGTPCPTLKGNFHCQNGMLIRIEQEVRSGIDEFTIATTSGGQTETEKYLADGKEYPVGSSAVVGEGAQSARCENNLLSIQLSASFIPVKTEKRYSLQNGNLVVNEGLNQEGQFTSSDILVCPKGE